MIRPDPQELTAQYQNQTLPAGDYYFRVSNLKPQIGMYCPATEQEKLYRSSNSLPPPQAKLISGKQIYLGRLQTITILAPVPSYHEIYLKDINNEIES